eukprot:2452137-Rhodomonas_salina.1
MSESRGPAGRIREQNQRSRVTVPADRVDPMTIMMIAAAMVHYDLFYSTTTSLSLRTEPQCHGAVRTRCYRDKLMDAERIARRK